MQIKPEHRLPTGNDCVSIPSLRAADAALPDINLLSMKHKGMIEFHGPDKAAFLRPTLFIAGKKVEFSKDKSFKASRLEHWVPSFNLEGKGYQAEIRVVAPLSQRGFLLDFRVSNNGSKDLNARVGAEGSFAGLRVCNNHRYPLRFWRQGMQFSGLGTRHLVLSAGGEAPEYAMAIGGTEELDEHEISAGVTPKGGKAAKWTEKSLELPWGSPKALGWSVGKDLVIPAGKSLRFGIFFGLGLEAISAAASAVEMRRLGLAQLTEPTLRFLNRKTKFTGDSHLDQLLNLNLWFNYFYAMGTCIDSEDFCCLTSRSPHYYVNGAYWDRDSMLWSFPAVLMVDPQRARRMLEYALGIQGKNIGVHSRFLDGTVLEPGFELDELCAPVIALSNYVKNTGDASLLKETSVKKAIRNVEKVLQSKKHPSQWLYETLSGPDDDFEPLPYLTYNNALVWRLQQALIELKPRMNRDKDVAGHKDLAEKVRSAIWKNLTAEGPKGRIFLWASDLRGSQKFGTTPPGCLQLLPYFGFCEPTEQVWRNTVQFLHSRDYAYSFAGAPFEEIGCAHAPQPWTLSISNSLLSGQRDRVKGLLEKLDFDGGIACEAFDSKTGKPVAGLAFATAAGFLAWGLWKAYGRAEALPESKPAQAARLTSSPSPGALVQRPMPLAVPALSAPIALPQPKSAVAKAPKKAAAKKKKGKK